MSALKLFDTDAPTNPIDIAAELKECERIIEAKLAAYCDVGATLERIRVRKLYQLTWPTFKQYVLERWGISKSEAYRQMDRSKAAEVVAEEAPVKPTKSAAEALAEHDDDPAFQRRVWARTQADYGENATAKDVEHAASWVMLEDVNAVQPTTQRKVVEQSSRRLRKQAAKAESKRRKEEARDKALRWSEKLARHVDEMERGVHGDFGRPLGIASELAAVVAKVKVWLKG